MKLLAAGTSWESLLVLVIFVVLSALSNWMKKKSGDSEAGEEPHPTPRPSTRRTPPVPGLPGPAEPQKAVNWQEELRQLLEGEPPAPTPPIIIRPPQPAGGPSSLHPPPVAVESPESAESLASLAESQAVYQNASEVDETVSRHLERRASLAESTSIYQQASQLDQKVAGHMRDVASRPVQLTTAARHPIESPEIMQTRALFRRPGAARQAIIASMILGPPKGLED